MNELHNLVYTNLESIILADVPIELHGKLTDAYKTYLVKTYSNVSTDAASMIISCEKEEWGRKTQEQKLSMLLDDPALTELKRISGIGYKAALATLNGEEPGFDQEEAEGYIEQMEGLVSKVRDFNTNLARQYLSEGSIDFQYAVGKTEYTSLRIGRIKGSVIK